MFVDKIIKFLNINSVLDIGCNYESIASNIDTYIGIDNDNEKIKQLRNKNFDKKNKLFININYLEEFLPKTDIVIAPEFEDVRQTWIILEKIRQSKAKYFLTAKDLSALPFYFPKSEIIFESEKFMYLYSLEDVEFYMEEYGEKISLLRKNLLPILAKHIEKIYKTFLKYDNGKRLFFESLIDDVKLDWQKQYYEEKIKTIVDDGIFDEYIDLLTLKYSQSLDDLRKKYNKYLNDDNFMWASIIAKSYLLFIAKTL